MSVDACCEDPGRHMLRQKPVGSRGCTMGEAAMGHSRCDGAAANDAAHECSWEVDARRTRQEDTWAGWVQMPLLEAARAMERL